MSKEVTNTQVDSFINDLIAVYEKHGLAISHGDYLGSFEVKRISDGLKKWLREAYDCTGTKL